MNFTQSLFRFTTRWRLGLLVAGIIAAVSLVLLLFIALGLFDYVSPFSDKTRPVIFAVFASVSTLILITSLMPLLRLRARDVAAEADQHTGPRRPVTTALDLSREEAAGLPPLRGFLVQRALAEGARSLGELSFPRNLPWRSIRMRLWQLLAVLVLVAGLCLVNGRAVGVIAMRLLHPDRDLPPWSPLVFEVTPQQPKVIYGSDAELEVKISGGPVNEGVVLLARADPDSVPTQAGAFAMGEGRFGQKLQRVVQPAQIAFAVGRARSPWIQVEVMRQPRFESLMIKVVPPAYTKLPPREFAPGTSDLVALAGSVVEARISSNRPLSGAVVTLTPPRSLSRDKPDSFSASAHGERDITLRWKVKGPALVRIDLKDITGAASAQPVELEQKLLPDQPPEVTLNSPAGLVFATPESEVPVDIEVQDDFGIARVDLVRKLVGFRDRGRTLTEDAADLSFTLNEKISMAQLGVAPGQTLEFYAEAHDHNPTLMGIGSSPIGRIQVISHEEYADLIRARTTLQEFQERFAALHDAVESVREALEKTAKGNPAGVAKAREAMQKTQELAEALSRDFMAFEAEKQIPEEAKKIAQDMKQMQQQLAQAGPSGAQTEAARQLEKIGESEKATRQIAENGKDLAALGRVMEMAAEFRAMHEAQKALTKGLEELSREVMSGDMRNAARLDGLAGQQQQVLDRWKAWDKELRAAAEALPEKYSKFKEEALNFAARAEAADIQRAMERAVARAKKVNTPDTFVNSQSALAGMDSLLSGSDNMTQACNSSQPHFRMNSENIDQMMAETLAQMLAGMCKKRGPGNKPGAKGMADGPGLDGGAASGTTSEGDPLLQAPVYGPDRLAFSGSSMPRGEGNGHGKSNAANVNVRPDAKARIDSPSTRTEARRQISLRDVPERYRDAVRRFYGEEAVKETTAPKKP